MHQVHIASQRVDLTIVSYEPTTHTHTQSPRGWSQLPAQQPPVSITRPHRSTTYKDAPYCCRPSSAVCQSVTLVRPAKTAEPIQMPFGFRTRVGSGNQFPQRHRDRDRLTDRQTDQATTYVSE